jgi:hypothetical protein
MKHKHTDIAKIWYDNTDFIIEKKIGKKKWRVCSVGEQFYENEDYRFQIPKDSEGNEIEVGNQYLINEICHELKEIDSEKAVCFFKDFVITRKQRISTLIMSFTDLYGIKPYKEQPKTELEQLQEDFPQFKFCFIHWGKYFSYFLQNGNKLYVNRASRRKSFAGFCYPDLRNAITGNSLMYTDESKKSRSSNLIPSAQIPIRPKYVVFLKEN